MKAKGVKDVFWHTRDKAWEVKMVIDGQTLYGGTFTPKDSTPEEVERARLLAVDTCRKLELRCKKKASKRSWASQSVRLGM